MRALKRRIADWTEGLLRPRVPADPFLRGRRIRTFVSEGRIEVKNSSVGFVVMLGAYFGVLHLSRNHVDPGALTAWTWGAGFVALLWSGSIVEFMIRNPGDERIWQHWIPRARLIMAACDVCVAASIWIILPALTGDDLFIAISIYVMFVLFQAIASTTATEILGFALLAVFGSLIAYCLTEVATRGIELAAVLAFFAVVVYAVRRFLRRAIVDALDLRFRAEESEAALERALATVAAERDAKTRFIASASHDLQQPIQAAWMFAESGLKATDELARSKASVGMRASFASVQGLLETMLDHLRLEAGAVVLRWRPVPLGPLFAEVIAEQHDAAEAAGLQLRAAPTSCTIDADPALLKRALSNLVSNVIRHSDGRHALIGVRRRGGRLCICVIDDGRGVAKAMEGRLFEDFAQGPNPDGAVRGGFGIGLASVRRIAELMGGTARHDVRWRNGAAFVIEIPHVSAESVISNAAKVLAA